MSGAPPILDFDAPPPEDLRAAFLLLQAHTQAVAADNKALSAANQALNAANAALAAHVKRMAYLLDELRRARFGKRSEKLDPNQLSLTLEELESAVAEAEEAAPAGSKTKDEDTQSDKQRKRAERNLGNLPKDFERVTRTIEPDSLACPCGCGEMVKIGEDRTERLDILPARFIVVETIRPKYACRACQEGVIQAAAASHLIEGGLPTEGAIAHVIVSKFCDHTPLYRQAKIYQRAGIDLHRATLAGWIGKASYHLEPVFERLAEHLKSSTKLFMDETKAPVLDPGRGKTKSGYLWALARDDRGWGGKDPPGVVYFYAPGRSGEHAEEFLNGFNGTLQVDGCSAYNRLTKQTRQGGAPILLAHCWAHGRRKLHDVFVKDSSPIAAQGLQRIRELYAIEAKIRGQSEAERLAARQERAKPLVEDFRRWLTAQQERLSSKSRLGQALAYIHNHWRGLNVFLLDGRVEMDSNPVENLIRPLVLTRKNALFAGHDEGGRTWGRMASLIETAKLNGVEPFAYLKATLKAIAAGHPQSRIDDLMPWSYRPS